MKCVVTAGPTYEPLDDVRRLTNFSTGRLGTELANHLAQHGHHVTLLLGEHATYRGKTEVADHQIFTTTSDLFERLEKLSSGGVDAVFHASAVSDYKFGRIWIRSQSGEMVEVKSGKISTRDGVLLAELTPTMKIISKLRSLYPKARLVGWKFEVEGNRDGVLALGSRQIKECGTDACVANGAAYGEGFGLLRADGNCSHFSDTPQLYKALENLVREG
jgi:phosphopantothenoylcysteine decarboxylase/phosphopantothenate--cysteine ligase